jgi:hypothetical protein
MKVSSLQDSTKIWKFGLSVIVLCGLLMIVLVKGFGVANFWTYGGQRTTEASTGSITVWIDTHIQYVGFLGLDLYARSRTPSSLRLEFNAPKSSCRAVNLRDLTLRYSDGRTVSVVKPNNQVLRPFQDYQYVNWDGDGLVTNRAIKLVLTFTNVVDRMLAVTVTCKGDFIKDDGSAAVFGVTEEFHPRKEIGVSPGWHTK